MICIQLGYSTKSLSLSYSGFAISIGDQGSRLFKRLQETGRFCHPQVKFLLWSCEVPSVKSFLFFSSSVVMEPHFQLMLLAFYFRKFNPSHMMWTFLSTSSTSFSMSGTFPNSNSRWHCCTIHSIGMSKGQAIVDNY